MWWNLATDRPRRKSSGDPLVLVCDVHGERLDLELPGVIGPNKYPFTATAIALLGAKLEPNWCQTPIDGSPALHSRYAHTTQFIKLVCIFAVNGTTDRLILGN